MTDTEMSIYEAALRHVYEHPTTFEPGQVWGIAGKSYRFIVLSSPEKSITGKDVRVLPVTNKTYLATHTDVILPKDKVYYSECVVFPYLACNILTDRFDLYFTKLSDGLTKTFIAMDNKPGCIEEIPEGEGWFGDNDPEDSIIVERTEELRDELFEFSRETLALADNSKAL